MEDESSLKKKMPKVVAANEMSKNCKVGGQHKKAVLSHQLQQKF